MTREKHPFSLSINNWIFFVVVAIIAFLAQYAKSEKTFFGVAESAGAVFATFIIPAFIAILFWLLRGKRKNAGRLTFNVVLFFLLLSEISSLARYATESIEQKEQFRNEQAVLLNQSNFKVVKVDYHGDWLQRIFVYSEEGDIINSDKVSEVICRFQRLYELDSNSNISFFSDERFCDYQDVLFEHLPINERDSLIRIKNEKYIGEYDVGKKILNYYPASKQKTFDSVEITCD